MNTPPTTRTRLPSGRARRAATSQGGPLHQLTATPAQGQTAARQAAKARAQLLMAVHTGDRSIVEVCELAAEGITTARRIQFRQLLLAATNWTARHTDTVIAQLLLDADIPTPKTRITVGWVADRPGLIAAVRRLAGIDTYQPDPYHPFSRPTPAKEHQ